MSPSEKDDKEKQERLERIERFTEREKQFFIDDHNTITESAKGMPILILGNHSEKNNNLEKIRETLEKSFFTSVVLKRLNIQGNHIHFERIAIDKYPIIIKVDGENPGNVTENVIISFNIKYQNKTILLLKEGQDKNGIDIKERVLSINEYFLYFPRIYFYKDDEDVINLATKLAIREAYRLVYLYSSNKIGTDSLLIRQM